MTHHRFAIVKLAVLAMFPCAVALLPPIASAQCTSNPTTMVNSTDGQWTLLPQQQTTYQVEVSPPIAADGSSTFPASRGVIPVQLSLSVAPGPIAFQSIGSNGYYGYQVGSGSVYSDDCSYLTYTPNTPFTFSQLSNLSADYTFTQGDCHGGSLRWSVETSAGIVYIYYGLPPEVGNGGTGGCTPTSSGGQNQSTTNMIGDAQIQYDTSHAGGTYYSNYADANTLLGSATVYSVSLVLDSGWQQPNGDQILTLGNVNVSTSIPTSDTFTAPTGPSSQTCTLPTAQIQVVKTSGADAGAVNTVLSAGGADTTGYFRVVDCKYMYNLDVKSLSGSGTYSVGALINGNPTNTVTFTLK